MKKQLFAVASLALLAACSSQPNQNADDNQSSKNPIFRDAFTADPAPMVWNDTLYVYVGHDEYYEGQDTARGGKEFNITEWLCYSTTDMENWTAHGSVLRPSAFDFCDSVDYGVGVAWASQVVPRNGKFYYYNAIKAKGEYNGYAVAVAVADSPTGPFKDAIGKPLICDTMTSNGKLGWWNDIDPTVLIEGDSAWLCWGGQGMCFMAKLKPNMIELDGEIQQLDIPNYTEGPWLHKKDDLYYLTYASRGNPTEAIDYCTAPSMNGPWTHHGQITGCAENSFTIHPGIINFKDKWYLFYHNATLTLKGKKGAIGRRSVCVDEMHYNEDGTIQFVNQSK
ncbi:MAG: family 43 glycosylhydrolase [Bacteroidales bacterium]|nr:family 43 glycosylhydrolase [Bacteroidales bacterium]